MSYTIYRRDGSELFVAKAGSLREAISGANLSGANLSRADLSGADLSGANLSGADLSRAYLSRAYLSGADLSGANLSGANLSRANLSRANLSGADLSGAYLSGANLSGADLSRANLSGAYLSGVYLIDAGQDARGFRFVAVRQQDVPLRVVAGCRWFTLDEADAHWGSADYAEGKAAQAEALAKVALIRTVAQQRGWIS